MFIPHYKFEEISCSFEGHVKGPKKRILKPRLSNSGHIYYSVRGVNKSGHRIIWECFCGPIPEGLEVNHKNGNKLDNQLSNLELVTHLENMVHAHQTGLLVTPRGEAHTSAKLNPEKVLTIRELFATGQSQGSIARLFGVHQGSISDIVNRKSWKHVN